MAKREVNMLSGPITKGLLTISFPIMIMNVLQSMFNIVDMTILKIFDSDGGLSVGAVGCCGVLITLITNLLIGISSGTNVVIAKHIGRGDQEQVERAIGTSVLFSAVGGVAMGVIGIVFAEVFLGWANCPSEMIRQSTLYFRLYFAGVPILMVYNFCASILRSAGDSKRPMVYLTVGGIIKVIFTFVFVAWGKMTVEGVAYATILSWLVSALLGVYALLKNDGVVRLKLDKIRFYKQELQEVLRIGVPTAIQKGLYSIANVIISAAVNSFGPAATTGVSIANNFDGILYQICVAPSFAIMPYVSQNVGARNIRRARQSVVRGILITVALGAFFGALSAIFSKELSSIMSDDPAAIAYSQQKMIIISSTYFLCGINEIIGSALRGMGKPTAATVATLVFMCAIRFVWVYAVFPFWPIGWVLSLASLLLVYFPTSRKLSVKFAAEREEV